MIQRPRLQTRLVGRFEARVVLLTAPAGSGKSSLIQLAVDDNALDRRGRDVVIALRPRDAEPHVFLARIAAALGIDAAANSSVEILVEAIHDAVWSAAPDEVAIWIDDAHVLDDDSRRALHSLVDELPANGHVVVASRHPIGLEVARRRAHGSVIDLIGDDLRLDDDELTRLGESLDAGRLLDAHDASTPRHAATAALVAVTGSDSASVAFLQEEVVNALSVERLQHLRRLVAADQIDLSLARELTDDPELDLAALVDGLPLVMSTDDGVRLHDLLRESITATMTAADLRKVRSLTGDALARRHDYVGAVDAHLAAGDPISARAVAERYVGRPTLTQTTAETCTIMRRIEALDGETPLVASLRATSLQSSERFEDELDAWRDAATLTAGSATAMEALALHRIAQTRLLDYDVGRPADDEMNAAYARLSELSETIPIAAAAAAHIRSQSAHRAGDIAGAIDALDGYSSFEPPDDTLMRWQRLTDLGLVERVGRDLDADDWATMPRGADVFLGYAMWLRGEGSPELAEAAVGSMIEAFGDRGQRVGVASAVGTGIAIALACGLVDDAERRLARLRELDRFGLPRTVRVFLAVADGLVTSVVESDDAGIERFLSYGAFARVVDSPLRPHLLALPFLYLAQPDCRPALDAMQAGPAITLAVDAGRALVALRETDDAAPAAALVWAQHNTLRNLVLPHHLAELACAADTLGHPTAIELLHQLPDVERQLRRVADRGSPIAAARAVELLGDLPRVEPDAIGLDLLGAPAMRRGDGVESLAARARPAELLAYLSIRGDSTRDDIIEAIWSGYGDDDKASANLRATLTQLQKLLEPGRPRDVAAHHLRAEGSLLSLHGVTTDVEEFERLHQLARNADVAGTPRIALAHYQDAMELYRGDLLTGHDSAWVVLDRVRLRSLASGAACRIAELLGARGDAEDAARWAREALRLEPLSDRAALGFVRSLIAIDDRSNAARALAELLAERERAGVAISGDLRRLAEQLPSI